jgi:hypothetical protein
MYLPERKRGARRFHHIKRSGHYTFLLFLAGLLVRVLSFPGSHK